MGEISPREAIQAERFTDDTRDGGDGIDLRGVIITLRKYKWPIIVVTAVTTAVTALVASSVIPEYRSTATLLFEQEQQHTFVSPLVGLDGQGSQYIQTQVEVLRSRTLAERVTRELKLNTHWEYNPNLPMPEALQNRGVLRQGQKLVGGLPVVGKFFSGEAEGQATFGASGSEFEEDRMIRQLMSRMNVQPVKKTDLVKVSVDGIDPLLATQIANEIGTSYIAHYLDSKDSRNRDAFSWLDNKVNELKSKLEGSEAALLEERQRIGVSGSGNDLSARQVDILTTRLVDAKGQMEEAKILFDEVRSARNSSSSSEVTFRERGDNSVAASTYRHVGTAYETLPVVDSSAQVQRNKLAVQEAQRQLDELNNRYGDKHPRVIDARSNLDTATKNLDRQIANVVSSVENKYRAASATVRSIQVELNSQKSRGFQVDRAQIKLVELEREVETNKLLYQEAYQRLREADEAEGLQSVNMSVADKASLPELPVRPKKSLMVMLGFLLSLCGASALAFAYESMKETVRGIQDVEKKLGLSVYGIVPMMKNGLFGRRSAPLIPLAFEDRRGAFEEAIRTIRTGATMAELESPSQVIMITSSVPGEGKSTVASNLAYSFSKLEKTLLIEADMRRPGLGRALGIRSQGLSELLQKRAYLDDCLRENEIESLDIIAAGSSPENHLELLASEQFAELIEHLKTLYDRIVIDLAPVQAVSDALVVGKHCDAAIYVVKADSTPLPVARRGVARLTEAGVKVTGAVVSQVDINRVSSYGGDYYYQGYYDYYGYGDNVQSSRQKKPKAAAIGKSHAADRRREQRGRAGVTEFRRRDPRVGDEGSNVA